MIPIQGSRIEVDGGSESITQWFGKVEDQKQEAAAGQYGAHPRQLWPQLALELSPATIVSSHWPQRRIYASIPILSAASSSARTRIPQFTSRQPLTQTWPLPTPTFISKLPILPPIDTILDCWGFYLTTYYFCIWLWCTENLC